MKMDSLAERLRGLNRPRIRQEKPGYSEGYYDLLERLEEYTGRLLQSISLFPQRVSGGAGETGANLKVFDGVTEVIIRINVWDGELFTSNVFYQYLQETDIPTPDVLYFDDSKRCIPYEFQVLEFLHGFDLSQVPAPLHQQAGRLVGQTLRKVHQIRVEGFGAPLKDGKWSCTSWLDALRENYLGILTQEEKRRLFSEDQTTWIEGQTFFNEVLDTQIPYLIHSDVGHGNGLYRIEDGELFLVGLIDPGSIIGGDPLFDLPAANKDDFSAGIWQGYTQDKPLTQGERYKYGRLRLLSLYWTTCWQFATGWDFRTYRHLTIELCNDLRR